jgi:hypothetical protein
MEGIQCKFEGLMQPLNSLKGLQKYLYILSGFLATQEEMSDGFLCGKIAMTNLVKLVVMGVFGVGDPFSLEHAYDTNNYTVIAWACDKL